MVGRLGCCLYSGLRIVRGLDRARWCGYGTRSSWSYSGCWLWRCLWYLRYSCFDNRAHQYNKEQGAVHSCFRGSGSRAFLHDFLPWRIPISPLKSFHCWQNNTKATITQNVTLLVIPDIITIVLKSSSQIVKREGAVFP
jgi:hypothetical protein